MKSQLISARGKSNGGTCTTAASCHRAANLANTLRLANRALDIMAKVAPAGPADWSVINLARQELAACLRCLDMEEQMRSAVADEISRR
jgi:hypothetical protein